MLTLYFKVLRNKENVVEGLKDSFCKLLVDEHTRSMNAVFILLLIPMMVMKKNINKISITIYEI